MITDHIFRTDYMGKTSESLIITYEPEGMNILKRMFSPAKEWKLQQKVGNEYYLVGSYTSKEQAVNAAKRIL